MLATSQKPVDHAKQSAVVTFKNTPIKVIQKTVETTGELIGNTVAHKITKVLIASPKEIKSIQEKISKLLMI